MTRAELLQAAMKLSPEDREELAIVLIESLDEQTDDDAELEWEKDFAPDTRDR